MRIEITHISVKQATKVTALLGFFLSLLSPLFFMADIFSSAASTGVSLLSAGIFTAYLVPLVPILGVVYGAAFGAAVALFYNFVAARWGGIEVTSREVAYPAERVNGSKTVLSTPKSAKSI